MSKKPPITYSNKEGPRAKRGPYQTRTVISKKAEETFIVICLDGPTPSESIYCLATNRIFTSQSQAEEYIKSIHPMRKPLIVKGDWVSFRLPD